MTKKVAQRKTAATSRRGADGFAPLIAEARELIGSTRSAAASTVNTLQVLTNKDSVLGAYLRPYLAKISRTRRAVRIADCFAGKGRFDDGRDGSPMIIRDAITAADFAGAR